MPRLNRTNNRVRRNAPQIANISQEDETIDLIGLFYRLLENMKYIIVLAILGAVLMGVWTVYFVTPQYKATSKIYVLSASDSTINLADLQIGTYLTSDYQEVFNNWIVHERVLQTLDLPYSYGELTGMLSVANPSNTRILYITVTSTSAQEAKEIADAYAKVAREFIASTFDTKEPNLFEEALLPTAPFSPSKTKNVALGFLAGLLLSVGVITVRFLVADKIRTGEDIEKFAGLPTLGTIPMQNHLDKRAKDAGRRRKKSRKGKPKHEQSND